MCVKVIITDSPCSIPQVFLFPESAALLIAGIRNCRFGIVVTNIRISKRKADVKEILRKLPAEDHYIIWNNLFEIEKDARLIRNKLASDFRLHAEIIKMCANGLKDPTN